MEEYTQITLDQWTEWKEDIRRKLSETAGNFVHIGYRLRQIRDSGMLDGAADIFEFAQREYGLGKSTVSRFIAINEKFSEGGNSLELKEEYRAISSSKLSEMLTLPDADCELITEQTTVKEIRDLKAFAREEAAGQQEGGGQQDPEGRETAEIPDAEDPPILSMTPMQKCIIDFFKDKKEVLNKAIPLIHLEKYKEAAELINPTGYGTHQKGIIFLFMYGFDQGIKYRQMGKPLPVALPWDAFLEEIYSVYSPVFDSGENDVYTGFYGEEKAKQEPKIEKKAEPEKEPEEAGQKSAETQENQGFPETVATSQQDENEGENDEITEEEERDNEDVETGGDDPENDPGIEVPEGAEEDGAPDETDGEAEAERPPEVPEEVEAGGEDWEKLLKYLEDCNDLLKSHYQNLDNVFSTYLENTDPAPTESLLSEISSEAAAVKEYADKILKTYEKTEG